MREEVVLGRFALVPILFSNAQVHVFWLIQEEVDVDLYDEVTEDQYKSIVKGRLQKDDFVIDDGVDGYMDNGMDDWTGGDRDTEEADSDGEGYSKTKKCTLQVRFTGEDLIVTFSAAAKKSKGDSGKGRAKPKAPPQMPVAPSISAYRPVVSAAEEDDFMSSILGTMDTLPTAAIVKKSRKRKPSPVYDNEGPSSSPAIPSRISRRHRSSSYDAGDPSSDGPWDDELGTGPPSSDDFIMSPTKKVKMDESGLTPAIDKIARLGVHSGNDDYDSSFNGSFDDLDMDAFMDVDEDGLDGADTKVKWKAKESKPPKNIDIKPSAQSNNHPVKKEDGVPSWLSVYDSLSVVTEGSLGPLDTSTTLKVNKISALEPDGSLRFFWIDYLELDGKLYFIGKLKDKTSGSWVSCCVTVEGMERNLFVLPREKRVEEDDEGQLHETDVVPEMESVYEDFDRVRKKMGIKSWKGKFVKRKYAFGEADVPKEESQWLKVVYGFNGRSSSFTLSSES